jgi:hypothetical protein
MQIKMAVKMNENVLPLSLCHPRVESKKQQFLKKHVYEERRKRGIGKANHFLMAELFLRRPICGHVRGSDSGSWLFWSEVIFPLFLREAEGMKNGAQCASSLLFINGYCSVMCRRWTSAFSFDPKSSELREGCF